MKHVEKFVGRQPIAKWLQERNYFKQCHSCGQIKPLSEYHDNPKASDGKTINCKKCMNSGLHHKNLDNSNQNFNQMENLITQMKFDLFSTSGRGNRSALYDCGLRYKPETTTYTLRFSKKFVELYPITEGSFAAFILKDSIIAIGETRIQGSIPFHVSNKVNPEINNKQLIVAILKSLGLTLSNPIVVDFELEFLYESSGMKIFKMKIFK